MSILTIAVIIICIGCQDRSSEAVNNDGNVRSDQGQKDTVKSANLYARLRLADGTYTKDSVPIHFTVVNEADTMQRFCKWETPFEPVLGKYLDITDGQGKEATFNGAMARRVMPPPAESYIEVPAHDSVSAVYNVAKNYSLEKGVRYTIKYTGGGVSGLEAVNGINIAIP